MRAEAVGQLLDSGHAFGTAFGDDVGGAELAGELLAGLVATQGDDLLRAELLGREDPEQADRAVPDDSDSLARSGRGGDGAKPTSAEHVRGRES